MLKTLVPATLVAVFALACSSSSFADGPSSAAPSAGDFRYQKALTEATKVVVRDMNGPIRVEPASGDLLEIVAIKTGPKEDVVRVQVVTREEAGTIVVCAVWPGQDASTCRPGASPSGSSDNDVRVKVEFRLRVPSKMVVIDAHTVNGDIAAQSPAGEVHLHTINGTIDPTIRSTTSACS